ncbi:hypothetical protein CU044_4407 [Streptomyces sp. L-9-10]|nr:hypothetical protein CU044_4407 [Streptomyces sp. L-9-10]
MKEKVKTSEGAVVEERHPIFCSRCGLVAIVITLDVAI